jgi:hypothetical protein
MFDSMCTHSLWPARRRRGLFPAKAAALFLTGCGILSAAIHVREEKAAPDDYFNRSAVEISIDPAPAGPAWVVVEYLDRGYALISAQPGTPQTRQWGVARINSGKVRRAWFGYGKLPGKIRFYGLPPGAKFSVSATEPPREPIPQTAPAIAFKSFPQRVTTAGADAQTPEGLPESLAAMRNMLPLVRALGFNGVESYVKWNFVERSPGVFDWSFYDAICDELDKHGLQWFPLLIAGSAYALPEWYHDSPDNKGFACLEHGISNAIQSVFCSTQDRYVERFLMEFGKHYGKRKTLLGVRLGPSGNYGEAQYPATGAWGYKGGEIHTHQGYWAADECASPHFRRWLGERYRNVAELNKAWETGYGSLEEINTFLPITARTRRQRIDFSDWYMDTMSRWCEQWAVWTRRALPDAVIHQSSGGWGPVQIGTDYSYQARSMAKVKGGIRLTNEDDNFADNFSITRMASSAARFYGIPLGYEPGGFGSGRGVVSRLFNCLTNGGEHLFYYHGNLFGNDQGIRQWLDYAPLLERREKPRIDVAVFYPDTAIKLDDEPIRYRWGSVFLVNARALRSEMDYDYVSEQMIEEGALDRYKALVFLWGHITEKKIMDRIAKWVEAGGTLIYPQRPRPMLETVEGERYAGKVTLFPGDPQPPDFYAAFIREQVLRMPGIRPDIRRALSMKKPPRVYWSVLESGRIALLNFDGAPAVVSIPGSAPVAVKPYGIALAPAAGRAN